MNHCELVTRIVAYANSTIGNREACNASCALSCWATCFTIWEGIAACRALAFLSKVVPVDALRAAGRGATVLCTVRNRTTLHNLTVFWDEFIACASTFSTIFCGFRDVQTETIGLSASQAFWSMMNGTRTAPSLVFYNYSKCSVILLSPEVACCAVIALSGVTIKALITKMNDTVFAEDIFINKPSLQAILLVKEKHAANDCYNTQSNTDCANHSHDWTLDSRLHCRGTFHLSFH